jgi:N4-gp56 family major capsid protein
LKAQKAYKITRILSASVNYGTSSIEASYIAVHHTDVEQDIRNMAGFIPVADYGNRSPVSEYELGTVEDTRYICSPDLDSFQDGGGAYAGSGTAMVTNAGTSSDVYPALFIGKEAYGIVPLRGQGSVSPTILRPGVKSKSDPLGQRGYVGWKTWHAAVILNQVWMARLECAVTEL